MLTVMAKTEVDTPQGKQDKVTAFLVSPTMKGFNITAAALEKVGMRGTKTANLEFRDMEVPKDNVLGKLGGGLKICLTVLDYGRTTFGAMCTGTAKVLLADAIKHARSRIQFKRPLASFGLVKKKIATMAALTYAMEASTYLTAGLVDSGHADIMLESAILKVFASDSLWEIIYDTMQIYGGRSFFTEYPYERMMRDARLNMIGEGSNEVLRAFIATVGLRNVGVEAQQFLKSAKAPWSSPGIFTEGVGEFFGRLFSPKVPVKSSELQKEADALSQAVRRFGIAVLQVLRKYREEVIEKQLDLERLTNCVIALYTMTAVLSRLDSQLQDGKADPNDIASGKLYCSMAIDLFNMNISTLFSSVDDKIENLSDNITGVHFRG